MDAKPMQFVENGNADVIFNCRKTKKNIFLIGDSIRKLYCATVREDMQDEAEIFYVDDNCRSSQYIIFSMKKWAAMFDRPDLVDMVQFNCGQWDTAHFNGLPYSLTSPEEYRKNIHCIILQIQKFFPNAKIIFATTTPMNPVGGSIGGVNPRSNDEVDLYNKIALEVCAEYGVQINDLNGFMRDFGEEAYQDTCHPTKETAKVLGQEVARYLRQYL